MNKLLSV